MRSNPILNSGTMEGASGGVISSLGSKLAKIFKLLRLIRLLRIVKAFRKPLKSRTDSDSKASFQFFKKKNKVFNSNKASVFVTRKTVKVGDKNDESITNQPLKSRKAAYGDSIILS